MSPVIFPDRESQRPREIEELKELESATINAAVRSRMKQGSSFPFCFTVYHCYCLGISVVYLQHCRLLSYGSEHLKV